MNTPDHCANCTSYTIRYCAQCNKRFCRECWLNVHKLLYHQPILPNPERIRTGFGRVNTSSTHKFAMKWWLEHSTYNVLTFDSSTCITLLATLRDDVEPFYFTHTRPSEPFFTKPVRKMLIKLMLTNKIKKQIKYTNKKLGKYINVQPIELFLEECAVQTDICNKSMDVYHPCDPLCPQIYWSTVFTNETSTYLERVLLSGIGSSDKSHVSGFFGNKYNPSIICMEFLEGYNTIKYHWKTTKFDFSILSDELVYEMMRLLSCGYIHTDLNIENIMYNPDNGGKNGKLQLIDFGNVRRVTPIHMKDAFIHVTRQQIFATNAMPFPDEKKVNTIINYFHTKTHDELLIYGSIYNNEIKKYGYESDSVLSVCSFLRDLYFSWLK
jgi:hypothetical protein